MSENTTPGVAGPSGHGGDPSRSRPGSWPRAWFEAVRDLTSVSAERREQVLRDTLQGSQPTATYYVLLGLSELIAGFALLINSDATLIGANVVAPLMTPIFGVSLGLMRSDLRLLRSALTAEFGGALLGVALCLAIGLLPLGMEPSAALLAQTKPTLIDLAVAALAGFAGGLAMIDERVSPALPGVAIATALNPPIAAIGLCLAFGAYDGAWGATVLFLANVLAILAVAASLFLVAGFVTREEFGSVGGLARRFAAAAVGLVAVTVLLTGSLLAMVRDLRTTRTIKDVITAELSEEPGSALESVETTQRDDDLDVLATVRTPRVLSPDRVAKVEGALRDALGTPVHLFLRCGVTKDVVATGTKDLRPWVSLESRRSATRMSRQTLLLQEGEQVAREVIATRPQIVLKDVELVELATGPVLIFSIENPREPSAAGVAQFEANLRERIRHRPDVRVVVRTVDSTDTTAKGRILFGEAHFGEVTPEQAEARASVERSVREGLERVPSTFVTAIDAIRREIDGREQWVVRAEAVGPRALTPKEVKDVEAASLAAVGSPVTVAVRTKADLMVTAGGYGPLGDVPLPSGPATGSTTGPAAATSTEAAAGVSPGARPGTAAGGSAEAAPARRR